MFFSDCSEIDCNENGIIDSYELQDGFAEDCNQNQLPDDCDLASGFDSDCNQNQIPDLVT